MSEWLRLSMFALFSSEYDYCMYNTESRLSLLPIKVKGVGEWQGQLLPSLNILDAPLLRGEPKTVPL